MTIKLQYFLYGFAFGLCFPVCAIIMQISVSDLEYSFGSIGPAHRANVLIYMIDSAPLFLGLFALVGGFSKQKAIRVLDVFKKLSEELNNSNMHLNNRSAEMFGRLAESGKKIDERTSSLIEGNDELHAFNEKCGAIVAALNKDSEKLTTSTQLLVTQHVKLSLFNETIHAELEAFATLNAELASKIRRINEIGAEIKILALNSSIEAHRGGSAGKSFAVIARQIGVMAESVEQLNKRTQDIAVAVNNEIDRLTLSVDEQKNGLVDSEALTAEIESNTLNSQQSLREVNRRINESLSLQERHKGEFALVKHDLMIANQDRHKVISTLEKIVDRNNQLIAQIGKL